MLLSAMNFVVDSWSNGCVFIEDRPFETHAKGSTARTKQNLCIRVDVALRCLYMLSIELKLIQRDNSVYYKNKVRSFTHTLLNSLSFKTSKFTQNPVKLKF